MHPHKEAQRTAYCRRQASACATAALASAVAEIKQAYLDLEQGWLCLAPKGDDQIRADAAGETKLKAPGQPNRGAPSGVPCRADPKA